MKNWRICGWRLIIDDIIGVSGVRSSNNIGASNSRARSSSLLIKFAYLKQEVHE